MARDNLLRLLVLWRDWRDFGQGFVGDRRFLLIGSKCQLAKNVRRILDMVPPPSKTLVVSIGMLAAVSHFRNRASNWRIARERISFWKL